MPNWCNTMYVAEGPKEQLQKLYDTMLSIAAMPSPGLLENGFGSSWLGNLVMALGVDPRKQTDFRCRGEYYNVELNVVGWLTFDTVTAWCEADDTRRLIEKCFPGVDLYYLSEEFGCGYWETNDIQGRHFSERYYFCTEDYEDYDEGNYYSDLSELCDTVSKATGTAGLTTFEECEQALQNCRDGDYDFALYRVSLDPEAV